MSTTIRVARDEQGQFALRFPDRCVYCGKPCEVELDWEITFVGYWHGKEVKYATQQRVPYCAQHARESKSTSAIETVVGCGVWLLVFLWLFFSVIHIGSGIVGGRTLSFLVSFYLSLVAAALATLALKAILPRLRPSSGDQLDLLGLKASFTADGHCLDVTFTHGEIAAEFAELNAASVPSLAQ